MNRDLFILDVRTICQEFGVDELPELLADYVQKMPLNPRHALMEETVPQERVINQCCLYFNTTLNAIIRKNNSDESAYMRQVIIYLLLRRTRMKSRTIAKLLQRDRSTISHSRTKIKDLMEVDISVRQEIEKLNAQL